jgi:hypothetical protein
MAEHSNPQSIGDGRLEDAGSPDGSKRDRRAEHDFDESAQQDIAKRKADESDDPSDDGDNSTRSNARENDASPGR